MTVLLASRRGAPESPGRGLKRKLGCIESATWIGRKRRHESEYELSGEIGEGNFGSIRICRAKAEGEQFACKALPKNNEETVHRKVEITQHLSGHPGNITLKVVFEDADKFYLIMEPCSGGGLVDEMAREGRFSEQRAAIVVKDLMAMVKYCHEMGVVHRDIKSENILLTKAGKMKLADFGLAARVTNGMSKFQFTHYVGNAWGEAALLLAAGAKGNRAALPSWAIMIKQVNISLNAAVRRLKQTREERDQFDEASSQMIFSLKAKENELSKSIASCNVESGVVQTWINFLDDTWQLQSSYNEQKEKKTKYAVIMAIQEIIYHIPSLVLQIKWWMQAINST